MLEFLRNIFGSKPAPRKGYGTTVAGSKVESVDSLAANLVGSQQAVETEQHRYLVNQFGLLHPYNLQTYLDAYTDDALSFTLVHADVNLTVSEFEFYSESDAVNEYMRDFHDRIDMDRVVWEIARDTGLYGFACPEKIGNAQTVQASTKLIAVRRIDERYMYLVRNKWGRIERWLQRPLNVLYSQVGESFGRTLTPESILYVHSLSPVTSYGQSILQPLMARLTQLNELIAATVKAHKDHANAVRWLKYKREHELEETQEEIDKHIDRMKEGTDAIDRGETNWMYSGGTGDFTHDILAADELPDATPLIDRLTSDIIRAAGFHPSIFGMGEADSESNRYSVNSIITRQRNLMSQIHAQLYSLLPFIEADCPATSADEIKVRMKPPTEETLKEQLEAEAIRLNNVGLKLRMGAVSELQAAQELSLQKWNDSEQLDAWLGTADDINEDDPNSVQQVRKSIDTMNDGKKPSNNPSGGESE